MSIFETIQKRKSAQSFRQEPLDAGVMEELIDFLSGLNAPVPEIDWNFDTLPYLDMVKIASSEPGVKAPCYLVLRAERKQFSLQNCGYLGERAVLFLTERGIASSWQGSIRINPANDFEDSLPYVTAIAIGMSDEGFRSPEQQADRKPLEKVAYNRVEGYKPIMEAARLSPSSFNRQPCVFVSDDRERVHIFRKKPFFNNPVTNFAQCVDAGAAMAHVELAAQACGFRPEFLRLKPAPSFKHGLIYQASYALHKEA